MGFHHTSNWQIFAPDGRRKYLDADERKRFLDAARHEPRQVRALCYFLVLCGCRISEALGLERAHISCADGRVTLRTMKRRKLMFRQIPLPQDLLALLDSIAPTSGPIWSVHRSTALRWIKRVMSNAGIQGPMACCRGTRHGFAIHAISRNVPPTALQKWMGHASFETTAIYLDAVDVEEYAFAERMW